MNTTKISYEEFITLPTADIARIIKQKGKPKAGIFVADGNRRMTMALTGLSEEDNDFYTEYVRLFSEKFMETLKVFFSHGLDTLLVPLISPTILKRSQAYIDLAINSLLHNMFKSNRWVNFFKEHDIRVKDYGNLENLNGTGCEKGIQWIEDIKAQTSHHKTHTLYCGFLSDNMGGMESINRAIDFFQLHRRKPSVQELKEMFYGENLAEADFFIMSTKLAGAGLLPPFICCKKTQMYFLPAPGVLGLTQEIYRDILFDILFCRPEKTIKKYCSDVLKDIELIKEYYLPDNLKVIGLGKRIGNFWIPDIKNF